MDIEIDGTQHKKDWLLSSAQGQALLKQNKTSGRSRPRCLCVAGGVEMYIAAREALHYLARMPGTSDSHSDECQSHCVPSNLYSPETPQKILSALLLNLPDVRKAKWNELRNSIMAEAEKISIDGEALKDRLLVPMFFNRDRADEQRSRYEKFFDDGSNEDGTRRRWLVAVLKEASPSKYGARVSLKQMPGITFWAVRDIVPCLLEVAADGVIKLGLFEVRKSSAGILILDCALRVVHEHAGGDITAKFPAINPAALGEEAKLVEVRKLLGLPVTTGKEDLIPAMIDYCAARAREK